MATDEQLRTYVEALPRIYREILAAFPRFEPNRKQGFGLAFQTFAAEFESEKRGISLGEIMQACQKLEQQGIVEIKHKIFVHPTPLGERLITTITGQEAPAVQVPELATPPL